MSSLILLIWCLTIRHATGDLQFPNFARPIYCTVVIFGPLVYV